MFVHERVVKYETVGLDPCAGLVSQCFLTAIRRASSILQLPEQNVDFCQILVYGQNCWRFMGWQWVRSVDLALVPALLVLLQILLAAIQAVIDNAALNREIVTDENW